MHGPYDDDQDVRSRKPGRAPSIASAVAVTIVVMLAGLVLGAVALPVYLALDGEVTSCGSGGSRR